MADTASEGVVHIETALLIGQYVMAFSHCELLIAVLIAKHSGVDLRQVHFMTRGLTVAPKLDISRRYAKKFFKRQTDFEKYTALLNNFQKCAKFRNEILHSAFLDFTDSDGNKTLNYGKPGESHNELFSGMKPMDRTRIKDQSLKVKKLSAKFFVYLDAKTGAT